MHHSMLVAHLQHKVAAIKNDKARHMSMLMHMIELKESKENFPPQTATSVAGENIELNQRHQFQIPVITNPEPCTCMRRAEDYATDQSRICHCLS